MFSQLKPGEVTVQRGQKGVWATIQLVSMDPGRQLSFDEASAYVYDTLSSLEAEKLLKAFLARHRKRFQIESQPALVMRIRLVDPASGI